MPDWVPYETNSTPALEVSIDMDYADDAAFRSAHPFRITVTAKHFATDADGQPSDEAATALFALDEFVETFAAGHDAAVVCTASGDGAYRIYVYAATPAAAPALGESLADREPAVDVRSDRDDAWALYAQYALSGEELEAARDYDQIEQMQDAGEDISLPWRVTFDAVVEETRYHEAREALANAGFAIDNEYIDNTVAGTVTLTLTPDTIKAARTKFMAALANFSPSYEGWGADEPDEEAELQPH